MTEYVGAIEKQILENTYFRQVLFTAQHSQLVVMCLRPGEEIGDEVHPKVDQFFRIERGEAKFVFNEKEERQVRDGDAVVVPAGTYHNVVNTSKMAMLNALYDLLSAESSRRDHTQDQSGSGRSRIGGTSLGHTAFSVPRSARRR
jgi:mannose-6-phosphate isomerase-like protein (cupin superfamily)